MRATWKQRTRRARPYTAAVLRYWSFISECDFTSGTEQPDESRHFP
jgi:hypothetical protein